MAKISKSILKVDLTYFGYAESKFDAGIILKNLQGAEIFILNLHMYFSLYFHSNFLVAMGVVQLQAELL